MAQPDRETVYQALIAFLVSALGPTGSATFGTINRRLLPLTDNMPPNGPFLFQTQKTEGFVVSKGVPPVRTFNAELWIYDNFGSDPDVIPSTHLNALVTAVENSLQPAAYSAFQQLAALVSSVLVSGKIEYYEGVLGQWGVAIIPVQLVVVV